LDTAKLTLIDEMAAWLPQLGLALVTLCAAWLLARLAHGLVSRLGNHRELRGPLLNFFARAARVGVLLFGAVTALGTLGVNISGLVAGLGLTGFALGFALKDSISNLLAGMLIIIYRPFELGDLIEVAGFAGRVTNVDLRYTELDADAERLLVPNSKLLTDPIKVQKNRAGGATPGILR
jgi:small conductance mechanosensitive channel